jgi:NADH-quinone oxidoreductase subunit L
MTVPLMILALLSLVGGWLALPAFWGGKNYFADFLAPIFGGDEVVGAEAATAHSLELILSAVAVVAATIGLVVAWKMYAKGAKEGTSTGLPKVLYNKYYVDEIYQAAVVGPLMWLSRNILWKVVDVGMIDGTVNGVAQAAEAAGSEVRRVQSGNTRTYAVWVVIGAILVFGIVFWPVLRPVLSGVLPGGVR